jgi:hypothetical protein
VVFGTIDFSLWSLADVSGVEVPALQLVQRGKVQSSS